MITFRSTLILAALFGAVACAPDRDLNDYRREREREDRARASRHIGVYSGDLIDTISGQVLGPLGLQLGVSSRPNDFNSPQAILTGELVFLGATTVPISFTNGSYNPDDDSFLMNYTLPGVQDGSVANATGAVLSLDARIEGDRIIGTISVLGESSRTGKFELSRRPDAKSVQGYMSNAELSGSPVDAIDSEYTGSAQFNSRSFSAAMRIDNLSSGIPSASRFANLFQRRKIVRAVIELREEGRTYNRDYTFVAAEWDPSVGLLEATSTSSGTRMSTRKLTCLPKNPIDPAGALNCQIFISGEASTTIELSFNPGAGEGF